MTDQERRLTHQQVLKLADTLRREAEHQRELAFGHEATGHLITRALVTNWTSEVQSMYLGESAKELADRVRRGIHEVIEAELRRQFSGQEI